MLDAYVFVISPDFVRDINLDLNVVNSVRFKPEHNPIMMLTMEEMNLMCRYFDLIHFNTVDNPDDMYVRSITRCLLAAAIYQMLQFANGHEIWTRWSKVRGVAITCVISCSWYILITVRNEEWRFMRPSCSSRLSIYRLS